MTGRDSQMIKNQIFKFRENLPGASLEIRIQSGAGGKKSKVRAGSRRAVPRTRTDIGWRRAVFPKLENLIFNLQMQSIYSTNSARKPS
jgi:hypothetical protein